MKINHKNRFLPSFYSFVESDVCISIKSYTAKQTICKGGAQSTQCSLKYECTVFLNSYYRPKNSVHISQIFSLTGYNQHITQPNEDAELLVSHGARRHYWNRCFRCRVCTAKHRSDIYLVHMTSYNALYLVLEGHC